MHRRVDRGGDRLAKELIFIYTAVADEDVYERPFAQCHVKMGKFPKERKGMVE